MAHVTMKIELGTDKEPLAVHYIGDHMFELPGGTLITTKQIRELADVAERIERLPDDEKH